VMDGLFYSGNEDYKDVSEILQNKLYYEAETLEMVLKVVSFYKDQSIQYLDAVIHLMYVMLRMLEKYSKNQDYIFVKKKAAKRSKKGRGDDVAGKTSLWVALQRRELTCLL
jgi:replication fork protection complex subunit Tof1/Swi1